MPKFSTAKKLLNFGLALLFTLGGNSAMSLEKPDYTVLHKEGGIEYRQYAPYLVIETIIEGEKNYKGAAKEGFKRLFRYISGNNSGNNTRTTTDRFMKIKHHFITGADCMALPVCPNATRAIIPRVIIPIVPVVKAWIASVSETSWLISRAVNTKPANIHI